MTNKPLFNKYTINYHLQRVEEICNIVKSIENDENKIDKISLLLKLNDEVKILSDGIADFYLTNE